MTPALISSHGLPSLPLKILHIEMRVGKAGPVISTLKDFEFKSRLSPGWEEKTEGGRVGREVGRGSFSLFKLSLSP